jgi:hypothetical protein
LLKKIEGSNGIPEGGSKAIYGLSLMEMSWKEIHEDMQILILSIIENNYIAFREQVSGDYVYFQVSFICDWLIGFSICLLWYCYNVLRMSLHGSR